MAVLFESALWDVTAVLSVICAFVYYYLTSTLDFWERRNVPYLKPEVFYGNMKSVIQFKKTQYEAFSEFYNHFKQAGHKFGGVFQLKSPVLLVCSADLAKDIFVKSFPHFHDRKFAHDEHFDPLSCHLICLEGQKWKFIRSKLNPAFSTSKLKGMLASMREIAEGYLKLLEGSADREEMVEMRHSLSRYTMDIIAVIAFGLEINAMKKESDFMRMGQRFFEPTQWERITQILSNTFPWMYKIFRFRMVSKELTEFFIKVVRDTMEHRLREGIQKNDFLHFLMKIKEENGTSLSEMEEMEGVTGYNMSVNENSIELTEGVIAAQAFVFFLAGYETSSSAMSTCVHVLAERSDVQEKILKEVEEILKKHGDLTYEAIQELVYVEQVLEETLRMYPPVGLISRQCTKPYIIPGTNVVIPVGLDTFIPVYSFHYDPDYFPEPKEFRPERFSPENKKNIVPYSYMPFGHGPRVCIGSRLAVMEMKMSLALLVKKFNIIKCEKTKPFRINPRSFFLTSIDGLWVRFVRR